MTYTVLLRDPDAGLIGAATASRSLAVGNAVLRVVPGVGAVASQAWTNRALRGLLLDELRAGRAAADAVARVPEWDAGATLRQVALLPETGEAAVFTGEGVTPWAGELVLPDGALIGNLLAGDGVLDAMRDASATPCPPTAIGFAARLVAVLAAGEGAGGDARGRQSAAVVVATSGADGDVLVDLRVDDHADPVGELSRLVRLRSEELVSARTE